MRDLHHSDIISYALTRLGTEFARDKQVTLKGLEQYIERTNQRRALGSSYYEEMDDSGPGYSIRPGSGLHPETSKKNPEEHKVPQ